MANGVRHLTEREVDERVEAMLNAKVLPKVTSLETSLTQLAKDFREFVGDGNGNPGRFGRVEKDVTTLLTEKTGRDAVAADLKMKAKTRDAKTTLIIAMVTVLCILVTTALGLLTWHYTHHADLLSGHGPVVVAQRYNSDMH